MASLIPAAGSTGSGSLTLQGPSTSSTQTVTIPDATGTMMVSGNMPACRVYNSNTFTVANSTFTKVPFNTKDFDTANAFDTTNNRFTPQVAGYYQITARASTGGNATGQMTSSLYKNTSTEYVRGIQVANSVVSSICPCVSGLVYLNGSTDYVEYFVFQSTGSTLTYIANTIAESFFEAVLVRTA